MRIETNAAEELKAAAELLNTFQKIEESGERIKTLFRFLTIKDVMELTGWSELTVQNLFKRDDFPACELGKSKLVFAPAFYEYAMKGIK